MRDKEARSGREQAGKTRSGANGPQPPEGAQAGLRSRRGLDAVAEGEELDRRKGSVTRDQ